ncbi:Serine/threonine-protein phosphatase 6 regulatory ankyrin repeat subunit, partial [Globisporangium polare]
MTPPEADPEDARWQPLEIICGEAPSILSNVYSLAMCVLEASTGEIPWAAVKADEIMIYLTSLGRPDIPGTMTQAQKVLIEAMWSPILDNRPTIASVAQRLKHFVDEENSEHECHASQQIKATSQPLDLESYVFPESGSTIKTLLEKLEAKCESCRESQEEVLRILERLQDVYPLVKHHRLLARDVAITSYSELLESFDRFLGIQNFREKSVLQRAKSQQVALRSNVFHRQLDELLELLAPPTVSSIHQWEQKTTEGRADGSEPIDGTQDPSPDTAVAAPAAQAVTIVRFETDKVNERFKELDFAAIDAASAAATTVDLDTSSEEPAARHLPWLIRMHELNKRTRIASGAFGEVFKATWLGTPVVLKFMGYEADGDAHSHEMFFHELRVWFPLNHPHVIKLFGACHVGKRFFVCEFAGNGTLGAYLKRDGNAGKSWQLLHQVGLGLQHLHEQNVLHNDLKCDNVLIGADDMAKLTDFGLSCILNSAEVKVDPKKQGALQWRSPEYIRGERLTLASDIYAFGMLIIEALIGGSPWGQLIDFSVRHQVVRKKSLPIQPECFTESHWSLIEMMCATEPTQRVTISFVVEKLRDFWQQQQQQAAARGEEEKA